MECEANTAGEMGEQATGRPLLRGYLMVVATGLMWSFGGVFVKLLRRDYDVDPRAIACLRSAVAGLVLAWALPGLAGAPRWRTMASGACYTVVVGAFVLATAGTTAANAIYLQYAYPLFVAVGAVLLFKERLGRRTVLALVLGMGGVATILICSWTPGQRAGLLYGFTSAFAFAAFALMQRSMKGGSPIALVSLYNLIAAALLFPLAYGTFAMSGRAFLLVAAMGTFQLGVPYVLFIKGLRTIPATDAALITLIEPILNPVWVWLFVAEAPARATLIGGALILVALLVRFVGAPGAEATDCGDANKAGANSSTSRAG